MSYYFYLKKYRNKYTENTKTKLWRHADVIMTSADHELAIELRWSSNRRLPGARGCAQGRGRLRASPGKNTPFCRKSHVGWLGRGGLAAGPTGPRPERREGREWAASPGEREESCLFFLFLIFVSQIIFIIKIYLNIV
jgi:hypothetical protein